MVEKKFDENEPRNEGYYRSRALILSIKKRLPFVVFRFPNSSSYGLSSQAAYLQQHFSLGFEQVALYENGKEVIK